MNPVANAIAGNWQVSGILSLHTGFPLTIAGDDTSGTNSRGSRANCTGPAQYPDTVAPAALGCGIQWFSPSTFDSSAIGVFGTCGVGTVRGTGLTELDASLQKELPVSESKHLELRADFINFTNTPIFNSPGSGLGPTLGIIQSSQGARTIQLALKFYF